MRDPDGQTKIFDRRFYPKGQIIIREGDFGNRAYFIEKGKLEVYILDKKGREIVLAIVGQGQIVGEMALITNEARTASVRIAEDSTLVSISHDIQKALEQMDDMFKALLETMANRVRNTNKTVATQRGVLADLEETTNATVNRISQSIDPRKQAQFKHEVLPLLDELRQTLQKYQLHERYIPPIESSPEPEQPRN